ncbi:MAG: ATP phosphoribosyltransferase [Asgard group archaeon]|nr:ATP phosphoribosyltransferase [Asgard group archaeon]
MSINEEEKLIRFGLPSKGRMLQETLDFFEQCGFEIIKRHERQYTAILTGFPNVQLVFQRQQDIIKGVQNGNLIFGIVGKDLVKEHTFNNPEKNTIIHDGLGFGKCTLEVAVPENWEITTIQELKEVKNCLRVASKFPNLTKVFFTEKGLSCEIISTKGTIEVAPALDYADIIVDLVSTGQTLADNRLKRLADGCLLSSQAVYIGNTQALYTQEIRNLAKIFLEYFDGALRARKVVSVFVNMRGNSPEEIAERLFSQHELSGLQGPTISQVISATNNNHWFAVHIIVAKAKLRQALAGLRRIGGSGVVVTPCLYVFEEEPPQYQKLLEKLDVKE